MGAALRDVSPSASHPSQEVQASKLGLVVEMLEFDMRSPEKTQGSIKQLLHGPRLDVSGLGFEVSGLGFAISLLGFEDWGLGFAVLELGFKIFAQK